MSALAPIALVAYKRPDHLSRTLAALRANSLAERSELWLFCDAPKSASDASAVNEVRAIARMVDGFASVRVIERERNFGLAASVYDAMSRMCAERGRGILLEDDLIVSPHFLAYTNGALDRYENVPKVMAVSGYMYPVARPERLPDTFFLRVPTSWGWATWQRAWNLFEANSVRLLEQLKERSLIPAFDLDGSYAYSEHLARHARGDLDVWAVRWYASMFLKDGLCLYPSRSMVHNGGMDGSGVHCTPSSAFDARLAERPVQAFTDRVEESMEARQAVVAFFRHLSRPGLAGLMTRAYGRLRRLVQGGRATTAAR